MSIARVRFYLISARFVGDRVQCIFSSRQTTRQRQQQHCDIADVVDVRSEFGGVTGPDLLSDFEGHLVTKSVVRRTFLSQHCLLGLEHLQLLSQPLNELLLQGVNYIGIGKRAQISAELIIIRLINRTIVHHQSRSGKTIK